MCLVTSHFKNCWYPYANVYEDDRTRYRAGKGFLGGRLTGKSDIQGQREPEQQSRRPSLSTSSSVYPGVSLSLALSNSPLSCSPGRSSPARASPPARVPNMLSRFSIVCKASWRYSLKSG